MLALGVSLLLLNITVGAAKYGMGRLGPHYATTIGSNEMWLGGDIFPSGHTANAVVTWGILAYLASSARAQRWLSAVSAVTSLGVGMATVYLGTHWLSDVLLGWTAGLLILLGLPWFEPLIARAEARIFDLRDRLLARRRRTSAAPVDPPPVVVAPLPADDRDDVGACSSRAPVYLAPGPHTARSERTPITPAGSRRPPHPERHPRGSTPSARPLTGG
jgi:hypothetical protein